MRIISGQFKGRKIKPPKQLPVRPTTDMAKEALFNILNNRIYFSEVWVLDLFSGTGSISFEFVSRGTTHITAVDTHLGCITFINKMAEVLNININTIKSDAYRYLEKTTADYDIIFADPPYNSSLEQFQSILDLVFKQHRLKTNGLLIIEHAKQTDLSKQSQFRFSKHYGQSMFSFFKED